jgi:phosphatidylglycerophosphate synthase
MSQVLWWLALAAAVLLTITPLLMVIRRAGSRRVPRLGASAVRPPWWASTLSFVGIPLLFLGARGTAGSANPWPYLFGAAGVSLLVQLGLILRHNRQAQSP